MHQIKNQKISQLIAGNNKLKHSASNNKNALTHRQNQTRQYDDTHLISNNLHTNSGRTEQPFLQAAINDINSRQSQKKQKGLNKDLFLMSRRSRKNLSSLNSHETSRDKNIYEEKFKSNKINQCQKKPEVLQEKNSGKKQKQCVNIMNRTYNPGNHHHSNSSDGELFSYLQKHRKENKENCAIKAYNYVHNKDSHSKPLGIVDSPEMMSYIVQAMNQCKNNQKAAKIIINEGKIKKQNKLRFGLRTNRKTNLEDYRNKQLVNNNKKSPNISLDSSDREESCLKDFQKISLKQSCQQRDLMKLSMWIKQKIDKKYPHNNILGDASTITQKIHSLHLGFSEACRQVSKYSNKLSDIFIMVHSEYHKVYQQLIQSFMSQNRAVKTKCQQYQDKFNQAVLHYQKELLQIRADFDQKSSKVIENFHKCIKMKNDFEKDSKMYQQTLKEQKSKVKYMQECLTRAISIIVEIGNERFSFLTKQQQRAIAQLSSFQICPEDSKIFYKWCATIIRNIAVMKKQKTAPSREIQNNVKDSVLSTIGKFMIDSDANLSIQDAKQILQNYVPHYIPNVISIRVDDINQNNLQKQAKINHKVPQLYEIRQKLIGKDEQVQVNQNWQYESKAIQCAPDYLDASTMSKPREKQKETCTVIWIREKMKLCSGEIDQFLWAERIQIKEKQNTKRKKLNSTQPSFKLAVPVEKAKAKKNHNQMTQTDQIYQTPSTSKQITKVSKQKEEYVEQINKKQKMIQINRLSSPKQNQQIQFGESKRKKINNRKVTFDAEFSNLRKTKEKVEEIVDRQYPVHKSVSVKSLNKSSHQEYFEDSDQSIDQNQNKMSIKNFKNVFRRDGMLNIPGLINAIVNLRSIKKLKAGYINLEEGNKSDCEQNTLQCKGSRVNILDKNSDAEKLSAVPYKKDKILLNLIKIPRKLLITKFYQYLGSTHSFRTQLIEKIQLKNKLITKSTMWEYKKAFQIQKLCKKIQSMKPQRNNFLQKRSINLQLTSKTDDIKSSLMSDINPILISYLRLYRQLKLYQHSYSATQFRKQLCTGKKIPYYHRLSPVFYFFINTASINFNLAQHNSAIANKFSQQICSKTYHDIKSLKNSEKEELIEVYQLLLDGRQTQLDIFIKTIHSFDNSTTMPMLSSTFNHKNESEILSKLQNWTIFIQIAEVQLFMVLQDYLNTMEINALISDIRNTKKDRDNRRSQTSSNGSMSFDQKISMAKMLLKIFKAVSNKRKHLIKKYRCVFQLIGIMNQSQSITFNDFLYLIEVLPIEKSLKKKLTYQSTFYLVYWEKKQPCIPYDRILFLFDSAKFLNYLPKQGQSTSHQDIFADRQNMNTKQMTNTVSLTSNYSRSILMEYFLLKIQSDPSLASIYNSIQQNHEYILENIYKLFFRVPPLIYRLTEQLKNNRSNVKKNCIMLVIFYRLIIVQEIQKLYQPGTLNILESISYLSS